ncbi:MAG: hypothetical protein JWM28_2744 [Chitinophagaceae bacterium]|nr:hypothetical protein [Chitinophagaceae bacterium]
MQNAVNHSPVERKSNVVPITQSSILEDATKKLADNESNYVDLATGDYSEKFKRSLYEKYKNIYFPDWDNKPPPVPDVLRLGETPILGNQNISALIANPGNGKSSIIEAIAANKLNPTCDSIGFSVDSSCDGIIIVDNERTNADVWNGRYRMCRRAGIPEGGEVYNVTIAGMRSVARLPERIRAIENLLEQYPCSLLLIDGAGDLVTDTNDLGQAIECRIWLREITVKFNTSIFLTLHPNPNSNKPRGHQGSEICREAECVLLVKPGENDSKIITSDFEQGKNRNNPKLTTAFKWSDEHKMFLSVDYEEMIIDKKAAQESAKRTEAESLAKRVLPPPAALKNTELVSVIMQVTDCSIATADRKIKELRGWNIITKHDDNRYRLNINS